MLYPTELRVLEVRVLCHWSGNAQATIFASPAAFPFGTQPTKLKRDFRSVPIGQRNCAVNCTTTADDFALLHRHDANKDRSVFVIFVKRHASFVFVSVRARAA